MNLLQLCWNLVVYLAIMYVVVLAISGARLILDSNKEAPWRDLGAHGVEGGEAAPLPPNEEDHDGRGHGIVLLDSRVEDDQVYNDTQLADNDVVMPPQEHHVSLCADTSHRCGMLADILSRGLLRPTRNLLRNHDTH